MRGRLHCARRGHVRNLRARVWAEIWAEILGRAAGVKAVFAERLERFILASLAAAYRILALSAAFGRKF